MGTPSSMKSWTRQHMANKLGVARSILLSLGHNKSVQECIPQTIEDIIDLVTKMTFIDKVSIRAIMLSDNLNSNISFESCLSKTTSHVSKVSYEQLRKIIHKLYNKSQTVPTKEKILYHFDKEEYSQDDLKEDLKANKFVLKRLANTKKALIVEDPSQIYKRMLYLNKIRSLRRLGTNFVYITYKDQFSLAVTTECILTYAFYTKSPYVLRFIESLIPCIPQPSVIILDSREPIEFEKKPNQYATKQDMKEWLKKHNIPFEDTHKAELYALIKKFGRNITEKCKLTEFLEDRGFVVMRVPPELPQLSYFDPIFRQIKEMNFKSEEISIQRTIRKYGSCELTHLEDLLQKEEMTVYCEDLEVERIVDMIGVAASRKAFLPKDFRSCGAYDPDSVPNYIILD